MQNFFRLQENNSSILRIQFIAMVLLSLSFSKILICQPEFEITDRIIYTVQLNTDNKNNFTNFLDSNAKQKIINSLCDLVYNGSIPAIQYWGDTIGDMPDFINKLNDREIKDNFYWGSNVKYYPDTTGDESKRKRDNQVYRDNIHSLSFLEKWSFDKLNNVFFKKVVGVILFQSKYTHNTGMRESYFLPLNDSTLNNYLPQNLITNEIVYDVPVTKNEYNMNSDFNWWYNYLEASKREKFFNFLTHKVLRDSVLPIQVYSPIYPFDSLIPRSKYINTGLGELYYGRTVWYNSDPLMFGMTDNKILQCCFELFNWTTIKKIRFHEQWYFDPEKFMFEKKVLGIGMIVDTYNENGQVNGEKFLVYYKLNS
jgi:hypothetical protein